MSHIVVHPRILMVDNDKRAIEALTALLSKALPNAYVADDVTDGTKALSLCRAYGNQYDIILLDMSLEGLQGPDICKRIRLTNNSTPILAMTSFSLNRYRNSAIESGAQGLVDKSSIEQFTQYIHGRFRNPARRPYTAQKPVRTQADPHRHTGNHHALVRRRILDRRRNRRPTSYSKSNRPQTYAEYRSTSALQYSTTGNRHLDEQS